MPYEDEPKSYEQVAGQIGLDELTTKRFVRYMRTRWADEEATQCATGYAEEWALRFKNKIEYGASDREGQRLLISDPELSPFFKS